MPVSGIVVVLNGRDDAGAQRALASDGRCTVGVARGRRVPVVVDAPSPAEGGEVLRSLERLPGVAMIEVVSVDLDDGGPSIARSSNDDGC